LGLDGGRGTCFVRGRGHGPMESRGGKNARVNLKKFSILKNEIQRRTDRRRVRNIGERRGRKKAEAFSKDRVMGGKPRKGGRGPLLRWEGTPDVEKKIGGGKHGRVCVLGEKKAPCRERFRRGEKGVAHVLSWAGGHLRKKKTSIKEKERKRDLRNQRKK